MTTDERYARIAWMRQGTHQRLPVPLARLDPVGAVFVQPPADDAPSVIVACFISYGKGHPPRIGFQRTRAHLQYLQREAGWNGQDATLFGPNDHAIDPRTVSQTARDDPHQFRLSISIDTDQPYFPYRPFIRELMRQVEQDFRRPLEWVAALHQNTDIPHVHVMLRGRDCAGKDLYIQRMYITRKWRWRARHLAAFFLSSPEVYVSA